LYWFADQDGRVVRSGLAFVFDLDGVIIDSMPVHTEAWRVYLERLGIHCRDIEARMHGRRNDEIVADLIGHELTPGQIFDHGARKEQLYRQLMRSRLRDSLIPGVELFLERHAGIPKAVASNAEPENINFVLDGLDLRRHFEVIIDGMQVQRPKPWPDIYMRAAEKLNIEPANCIVFEDSPPGVAAARKAGARVVGIESHSVLSDVDFHVKDFTRPELAEWLTAQTAVRQ
jgi:HAD superfamily hydrolase (TIGR01509 family)